MDTDSDGAFAVKVIVLTTCALSILGTFAIFLSYFALPIRATSRRLLVYLSVCDLITAVGYIVALSVPLEKLDPLIGATQLCITQAAITTASSIASFLWTVSIAFFLYLSIRGDVIIAERAVYAMHVVCWCIPIAVVYAAYHENRLGYDSHLTSGWCWLRSSPSPSSAPAVFWEMMAGKGWELASYIATPVLYVLIKLKMNREVRIVPEQQHLLGRAAREAGQQAARKLTWVPLIFILLRLPGTTRSFLQFFSYNSHNKLWLIILQAFGDCGQGFANGVLFCLMTEQVRIEFKRRLCRPFGRTSGLQLVNSA